MDLDGTSAPTPRGSMGQPTVELLMPRMQWLLPHHEPATAPGEQEEGTEPPAEGEGDAEGSQSGETSKRKMELMKPSIDVKYVSGWPAFVQKMTDFIFFHNTVGYEHTVTLDISDAPTCAPAEGAEEAAEAEGEMGGGSEGDEGGQRKTKDIPKPKAGIAALYVDNTTGVAQDVLLCLSSACFKCPMTVQELDVSAWRIPPRAESSSCGVCMSSASAYIPAQITETDSNRVVMITVGPGPHLMQLLTPAGVEAQVLASSNIPVELGDEAILCEKMRMSMVLERGVAPPLTSGKEVIWLRRSLSVTVPTSLFLNLRVADPALRNSVQLMLVKSATGDMVEAANDCLGPLLLEPDDAGYMLLARSFIGMLPAGYDLAAEEFSCPWMLRSITDSGASVAVKNEPTEFVFDANGYYVDNYSSELFRYQINPPAPPPGEEPAEGQEAPPAPKAEPVHMTVQLRTHSPAVVNMYLLDVATEHVWSQELEQIDSVSGLCNSSMERDGAITAAPMRFAQGLNGCTLPEVRLLFQPGLMCGWVGVRVCLWVGVCVCFCFCVCS